MAAVAAACRPQAAAEACGRPEGSLFRSAVAHACVSALATKCCSCGIDDGESTAVRCPADEGGSIGELRRGHRGELCSVHRGIREKWRIALDGSHGLWGHMAGSMAEHFKGVPPRCSPMMISSTVQGRFVLACGCAVDGCVGAAVQREKEEKCACLPLCGICLESDEAYGYLDRFTK